MKKILFAMLILAVVAGAEEFTFEKRKDDPNCEVIKYDTFTHEFTPKNCSVFMECYIDLKQYEGFNRLVIDRPRGSIATVDLDNDVVIKRLSLAEFSIIVSSGAFDHCENHQLVRVNKSK